MGWNDLVWLGRERINKRFEMMENATEIKNPLLETYGTVVKGFFSKGKKIDDPVFIFPGVESTSQADELPYKPDLVYFDPGESQKKAIQNTVKNLRKILESEGKDARQIGSQKRKLDNIADRVRAVRGQADGIQQLQFHLDAFYNTLKTGDESLLKGNPFYALTKLIFNHNIKGAVVLLNHLQADLVANAPEKIQPSRTFKDIWGGPKKFQNISSKIVESIGSLFNFSKILIECTLFIVSSFTTYLMLDALLHTPSVTTLFDRYFTPNQGDLLLFMLAALGSFLLTVAILDLKAKLFRGMAEKGTVLSGIRATFLIQPRWLVLALFLVLISVKANYDSISTLFSKKEYLSEQRAKIQKKVEQALGSTETADPTHPQSLHDLRAMLQAIVTEVSQKFARLPDEEISGKSRSGDPRKGPRYWGKYFIVHGGFELGVKDVAHSFRNVQFARNMDQQLKDSGIPFDVPFSKKLAMIAQVQAVDMTRTAEIIRENMAELDQLMQVGSLSLSTVQKIFSFDNKKVNTHIQEISKALNAHRNMFDTVVAKMDKLSEGYIAILAKVDRSGVEYFSDLRVQSHMPALQHTAITALQSESVPMDDQKSLAELTLFLGERYGSFHGNLWIALILFLSFAIDYLSILLFSRKTARQGVADAQIFEELLKYLKDWEDAFIDLAKSFFYRPATQQVFRGLTFPNETGVRNAFFKLLEEIDSDVKDIKDCSAMEQRQMWVRELFVQTRTIHVMGYNARVGTIETFLSQKDIYLPQLIKRLFPGIPYEKAFKKSLGEETFLHYYTLTEQGQARDKERFSAELKSVGRGDLVTEEDIAVEVTPERGVLSKVYDRFVQTISRLKRPILRRKKSEVDQWTVMVQQAVTSNPTPASANHPPEEGGGAMALQTLWYTLFERGFMAPFPTFPHTRRNWLIDMSSIDEKSLEDLDTLHDFIPDFVKMLKKVLTNTLPVIQESLEPLEDICARFPEQCLEQGIVVTSELKDRFKEIEKESLGMWGACVAHLLGEEAALNQQFQKPETSDLASVLTEGGDISQFYERIHTLMSDARQSALQAKNIEEAAVASINIAIGEIKELCENVNQMLVKINILSLDLRRKRPLPHAKLRGLNEGSALLERAPREARAILEAREKVLAGDNLFVDSNYYELLNLKSQAQALHSRVDGILNLVDK